MATCMGGQRDEKREGEARSISNKKQGGLLVVVGGGGGGGGVVGGRRQGACAGELAGSTGGALPGFLLPAQPFTCAASVWRRAVLLAF